MSFTLLLMALTMAAADAREDPCVQKAADLVAKLRDLSDKKRARAIELAVRRDVTIVCGVVEQSFFGSTPEVPRGCTVNAPLSCTALRSIAIPSTLEKDVDPITYIRIETIARRLADKKLLSDAHKALLSAWLVAAAASQKAAKEHGN